MTSSMDRKLYQDAEMLQAREEALEIVRRMAAQPERTRRVQRKNLMRWLDKYAQPRTSFRHTA